MRFRFLPYWVNNEPNSKWSSPLPNAAANLNAGSYVYRTTFDLSGMNPATAVLTGGWAAADSGVIKINGAVAPNSNGNSYTSLTPFTINTGFIAGVNTLDFVITSPSGTTGVRLDIGGTASPTPAPSQNSLLVGTPILDRPTLTALGIKLPISGDVD